MPPKGWKGKYKKGTPSEKLTDYVPLGQVVDALRAWGCHILQDAHWTIFTNESKFGADDAKRLPTHVDFIVMGELLRAHGDAAVADPLADLVKKLFVEAHTLQPNLNPLDSLKGTIEAWGCVYDRSLDGGVGLCQAIWGERVEGSEGFILRLPAPFSEDGLEVMRPEEARQAVADFLSQLFKELQPIAVGI